MLQILQIASTKHFRCRRSMHESGITNQFQIQLFI